MGSICSRRDKSATAEPPCGNMWDATSPLGESSGPRKDQLLFQEVFTVVEAPSSSCDDASPSPQKASPNLSQQSQLRRRTSRADSPAPRPASPEAPPPTQQPSECQQAAAEKKARAEAAKKAKAEAKAAADAKKAADEKAKKEADAAAKKLAKEADVAAKKLAKEEAAAAKKAASECQQIEAMPSPQQELQRKTSRADSPAPRLAPVPAPIEAGLSGDESDDSFPDEPNVLNLPPQELALVALINFATLEELKELKGIGPKSAVAIMAYREKGAQFNCLDDLSNKAGLPKTTKGKLLRANA